MTPTPADLAARLRKASENRRVYAVDFANLLDDAADAIDALAAAATREPTSAAGQTPSSHWHANGEPDPHGKQYDCERATLAMGKLTDDELANGAFLNYDVRPPLEAIIAGTAHSPIAWMTAVKDRIRWLSRSLDAALSASQTEHAPLIHYPEHWDTAAYPTLESAVRETLAFAGCSACRDPAAYDIKDESKNAHSIVTAIARALAEGHTAGDILDENSPLRDAIRAYPGASQTEPKPDLTAQAQAVAAAFSRGHDAGWASAMAQTGVPREPSEDVLNAFRALQIALDALNENHQWHKDHDDYDGYEDSEIECANVGAIACVESALRATPPTAAEGREGEK